MTRIVYIPTNRPCAAAAGQAIKECRLLRRQTGHDYLFLLVEHENTAHVSEHASLLAAGTRQHHVSTLHLTPDRWRRVLTVIMRSAGFPAAEQARLRKLLSPVGVAYSAGPNKAFLLAAALEIDTLHRRDSDHLPASRPASGQAFPGVLEAAAIGLPLDRISPVINRAASPASQAGQVVSFVGSSTFGDPPHDRRDLLAAGESYVVALERLADPGAGPQELAVLVPGYFVTEPRTCYDSDFYELDLAGRTELGVSCVKGIFRQLPEMPVKDTLACDYFQKNLLHQLGRPVLFHSRKMRHAYDPRRARGELPGRGDYALRDLRYLILWRVWSAHNRYLRGHVREYLLDDGSIDADRYARGLTGTAADVLPEAADMPARYAGLYAAAAAQSDGLLAGRLRAVAAVAARLGTGAVADVRRGLAQYAWLIARWPELIRHAPAARADLEEFVMRPRASGES